MKHVEIPLLTEEDIEVRVQSVSKSKSGKVGAVLLLYKNARTDMKYLDAIFGMGNWQRTHEVINGDLYCNIDIWDEDKNQWIRKQDVGTEGNTEKEKSRASDSFKRCSINIGIGRELYSSPFTYVELRDGEYYTDKTGQKDVIRCSASVKFKVAHIGYNESRAISELTIVDRNNDIRFSFSDLKSVVAETEKPKRRTATKEANPALKCSKCGDDITEAEQGYSMKNFGVALCRSCQKGKS